MTDFAMSKSFTIIILFLNEKYEVKNTLGSIKNHSTDGVEIILIKTVCNVYPTEYAMS